MEEKNDRFSIRKRAISFRPAIKGLAGVWKWEHNFRIHLAAGLFATLLGFLFGISRTEWIGVILCIGLVISTEIMNTAVEKLVDFVSPGHHPMAGLVKDLAAAAVLVSAATALVAGLVIFLPYLVKLV